MSVSNFDEHKTVDQLKKEVVTLMRENKAAMLTIDKLLKNANVQSEKIKQLESLLAQNVPVIKKEKDKIVVSTSAEEEIAETQLERLRQSAKLRVLTLEEVRTFDLLVKNKRLVTDESTLNLGKDQYRDVTDSDLMQLAAAEVKHSDDTDSKE